MPSLEAAIPLTNDVQMSTDFLFLTPDYMDYTSKSPSVEEPLSKTQHSCLFKRNTMKQLFQF